MNKQYLEVKKLDRNSPKVFPKKIGIKHRQSNSRNRRWEHGCGIF